MKTTKITSEHGDARQEKRGLSMWMLWLNPAPAVY
jgi:hypothetical protein